ncbi:hypothetical protein [Cohnella nanjingensis]|uniref:Uncharacterized protein n=1 Tax=Cohnella nanjingensis TaxID=1387779 RepID=A0A7X0VI37_9BACL|nr:hypothetical protein [Cohnella nanjingensis]MBB6674123.1 hypothetical protein [Cohnella nanjingensis]
MNLADMLSYADIAQLSNIADTYDCECSSHSKHELIQSILTVLGRREALETRVGEMSLDDLRFLNSLLFEKRAAYSLEDLTARAASSAAPRDGSTAEGAGSAVTEAAGADPRKGRAGNAKPRSSRKRESAAPPAPPVPSDPARGAIARFKRFGWLFNGFSQQTKYLYHVPEDVKKRLCEALDRKFRDGLQARSEPPAYRDERSLLSDDAAILARFVRDHDVPLTSDGYIYKRQLQQLLDLLSVVEPLPGKSAFRFGYGRRYREYPDRFSLLYDYCYFAEYIEELPERLVLTEKGRQAADGELRSDPSELYRFWMRLYKSPIPNLQALVQWVMRLSGGAWVTVSSLSEILLPLIRPYYYDSERDILDRRLLAMMLHLGLLRYGETADGEAVVTMTPQGRALVSGNEVKFEDALPWTFASVDSG